MRKSGINFCLLTAFFVFIVSLNGCMSIPNSPNSRFYMLNAIDLDKVEKRFDLASEMILGVGPVTIPEYLNRPQIVTQDKKRMLKFAEFERWGEPLDLALTRLLSTNLDAMLSGGNIEMYPWNLTIPVNYQVLADIVRLESELEGDMLIVLQWSILDAQDNKMVLTKRFEFRNSIEPHTYPGMVETLSAAWASLSADIAGEVSKLPVQPKKKTGDAS